MEKLNQRIKTWFRNRPSISGFAGLRHQADNRAVLGRPSFHDQEQ